MEQFDAGISIDQMGKLSNLANKAKMELNWNDGSPSAKRTDNLETIKLNYMLTALKSDFEGTIMEPIKTFELVVRQQAAYLFNQFEDATISIMVGAAIITQHLEQVHTPKQLSEKAMGRFRRGIAQYFLPVDIMLTQPNEKIAEAVKRDSPIDVMYSHLGFAQRQGSKLGIGMSPLTQVDLDGKAGMRSLLVSMHVTPSTSDDDLIAPLNARIARYARQVGELFDDLFRSGMTVAAVDLPTNTRVEVKDPATFEKLFKDYLTARLISGKTKISFMFRAEMP